MQMKGKTLWLLPAEAAALAAWLQEQAAQGDLHQNYMLPGLVRCLGECLAGGRTIKVVAAERPPP